MNTSIDADDQIQTSLTTYSDMVIRIAFQNLKSMADAGDMAVAQIAERISDRGF